MEVEVGEEEGDQHFGEEHAPLLSRLGKVGKVVLGTAQSHAVSRVVCSRLIRYRVKR